MRSTFKITFVDSIGRAVPDPSSDDVSNVIPVIKIIVCPPGVISAQGVRCKALVDTGADYAVVDRALIGRAGGTVLRAVTNRGATGRTDSTLHDISFLLTATDGFQVSIHADAVASDHAHAAYPVIVGRSLFRHGTLVLDYRARIFQFQM